MSNKTYQIVIDLERLAPDHIMVINIKMDELTVKEAIDALRLAADSLEIITEEVK